MFSDPEIIYLPNSDGQSASKHCMYTFFNNWHYTELHLVTQTDSKIMLYSITLNNHIKYNSSEKILVYVCFTDYIY